ncbi:hypothetical protein D8B26_000246 [Coccidioides posadasii str. Silveira]|uniref:Uncharacterized protein n=3 Tax=Coccidioides posadasii TaxID=199306 RepID=E9D835_COCPS|nr:hypothetical protein CPC735_065610 [Coccidioides posadasii C735 delta SOWgp]EER25461.1 hypothetical protein CPC735_065610 [Coccidioides posadasii C735 delta SOWgp]EFW17544.1 conserved hypothetical protein [Coccidioides posadasii str. Silveira]KMM70806.1 hypothetical protein CPAG_07117 [Coccidioides posadasii RMSCC 3488]QVM05539.1 hypothetical protein D8B26_000246 [Coccidioides posadasii str. Silveira]|eukprot:XP_003067606.1 hypothetical protein CPC735_065610 [Coccidioides posadasii C735 delta SOWgp]
MSHGTTSGPVTQSGIDQMIRTKNPVIVMVPGAWHTPAAFDLLNPIFQKHNYDTWPIQLPSVGISPGLPDMSADVAAVRSHVKKILDKDNRDVVIVMHSYSAVPATEAMKGLGKNERTESGRQTGVVALLYIACLLPTEGRSSSDPGDVPQIKPVLRLKNHEDGTSTVKNPIEAFYHDVEPSLAESSSKQLKAHSDGAFLTPLTHEAYRTIPSAYLLCKHDRAVPLAVQQYLADAAGIEIQETLDSGHSPFLSQPHRVIDFVLRTLERFNIS